MKVGEPGNPIATVECGKKVLVGGDETFAVNDHDFYISPKCCFYNG